MKPETKAMLETWEVKEEAWKEVAHLPLDKAIEERLRIAETTARRLGFGAMIISDRREGKPIV